MAVKYIPLVILLLISKIIFIILVLSLGTPNLKFGAGLAVIIDSIMIVLFVLYLLLSRSVKLR